MATENNDQAVRSFQLAFKQFLQAVFRKQSYFGDFFAGGLEALDGVQENETAFYVKTSDTPVVIGDGYKKDANTAFGTGTGKSTRFGDRKEIIYHNTPAKYTWEWDYHEGIDRYTVNNAFDQAIADRLDAQAQAKIQMFNKAHGKYIASVAAKELTLLSYSNDAVLKFLNDASKYFVNIQAVGNRVLRVNSDLYNAIVDHPLVSASKHSAVNIDENGLLRIKGFGIQEVPDEMFAADCIAYTYIQNVAKAFTGIVTARTIESEDFDGVAFQGAGKAGEFIIDDNKKAVVKVKMATPEG